MNDVARCRDSVWDAGKCNLCSLFTFRFNPRGPHYYCTALRDAGECRIERIGRMNDIAHFKDPKIQKRNTTVQHSGRHENANVFASFLFLVSIREARIATAQHSGMQKNVNVFFPVCFLFQSERHASLLPSTPGCRRICRGQPIKLIGLRMHGLG